MGAGYCQHHNISIKYRCLLGLNMLWSLFYAPTLQPTSAPHISAQKKFPRELERNCEWTAQNRTLLEFASISEQERAPVSNSGEFYAHLCLCETPLFPVSFCIISIVHCTTSPHAPSPF